MDRKEIIALKLQMGINPSTRIEPNILRNMWQQLKHESVESLRKHSNAVPRPNSVTTTPMVV